MKPDDYEAVRCGMSVAKAIMKGDIQAGVGLENVQMVELEEWLAAQGRPKDDVQMLRIDELAELGCCCFCSILYIGEPLFSFTHGLADCCLANEKFMSENPEKITKFMRAVKKATDYVLAEPKRAYADYVDFKPIMGTELNRKIYERSYAYFSKDLQNVKRDWVSNKVSSRFSHSEYCTGESHQVWQTSAGVEPGLYSKLHQQVPHLAPRERVS